MTDKALTIHSPDRVRKYAGRLIRADVRDITAGFPLQIVQLLLKHDGFPHDQETATLVRHACVDGSMTWFAGGVAVVYSNVILARRLHGPWQGVAE